LKKIKSNKKALISQRLAYSEPKRVKTDNTVRDNNIFALNNSELRAKPSGKPSSNQFYLNKSDIVEDRKKSQESLLKYPFGTDNTPIKSRLIQKEYLSNEKMLEDPARQRGIRIRADNILKNYNDDPGVNIDEGQSYLTNRKVNKTLFGEAAKEGNRETARDVKKAGEKIRDVFSDTSNSKNKNEFGLYSSRMEFLGKIEKKVNSGPPGNSGVKSSTSKDKDKAPLREALQRRIQAKSNEVHTLLFFFFFFFFGFYTK
jgi:hypothetical protein